MADEQPPADSAAHGSGSSAAAGSGAATVSTPAATFDGEFESPVVRSYPTSGDGRLTLADESATAKRLVRADADGPTASLLGARFASSRVAAGGALVLGSRPGEWAVLGTPQQVAAVTDQLDTAAAAGPGAAGESAELVSHLDWTHGRAMFRVTGHEAPRMLEKVCGLDWSDPMTPDGAAASASVAMVTCDLARNDADGKPSYLILCDRSFGQYLFDALADAGEEFGLTISTPAAQ